MSEHDHDWLDEHLARSPYLSDDGFTARVLNRMPESRPDPVRTLRWYILFVSTTLAGCLALVLGLWEIGPLMETASQVQTYVPSAEAVKHFTAEWAQPGGIYAIAGCLALLSFASIPFLRRWV